MSPISPCCSKDAAVAVGVARRSGCSESYLNITETTKLEQMRLRQSGYTFSYPTSFHCYSATTILRVKQELIPAYTNNRSL